MYVLYNKPKCYPTQRSSCITTGHACITKAQTNYFMTQCVNYGTLNVHIYIYIENYTLQLMLTWLLTITSYWMLPVFVEAKYFKINLILNEKTWFSWHTHIEFPLCWTLTVQYVTKLHSAMFKVAYSKTLTALNSICSFGLYHWLHLVKSFLQIVNTVKKNCCSVPNSILLYMLY